MIDGYTELGWARVPLRRLAVCRDDLREPVNVTDRALMEGDIPYWGANSIQDYVNRAKVTVPVVLLGEDGAPFYDRDKPVAFYVDEPIWPNNHIHVLLPSRRVDGRWLAYALNAVDYSTVITGSTRDKLTQGAMMSIPLATPTSDEQRAIADYLDQETAQIDALVAKQEEFIGLLRERRRIVVPSILSEAKLTDHRPDKLHRRTRMGNGSTPRSGEDSYYVDGTVPWVNSSVVNQTEVWEPSKRVTQKAVDECHLPIVKPGSILVALTGQGKTRGAATMLRITSTINQHLAFIEPDKNFWLPEYLLWVLRSDYDDLRRSSSENGATKGGLTVGDLRDLKVSMPDLDEQSRLVNKLEEASARIDTLIAKAEEHIALAKERRAALITEAVTGQFDVRTARKAG